jgi:hypothetical protein
MTLTDQAAVPKKGTGPDNPIRRERADHTASRAYTSQQLRDAVAWRELPACIPIAT